MKSKTNSAGKRDGIAVDAPVRSSRRKHTPIPWGEFLGMLIGPKNQDIGLIAASKSVCTPRDRHNAAFVVQCVNSHYKLVEASELAVKALEVGARPEDQDRALAMLTHALSIANDQGHLSHQGADVATQKDSE